jgi:mycoredoxin
MAVELYGTRTCPYTAEMRDELEWQGRPFVEYDVEGDPDARERLRRLCPGGALSVPVLVEDGVVMNVGHNGRSCYVGHLP